MNIINKSKLILLSLTVLSISTLSGSGVDFLTHPGSDCKAYYAGQQNRINYYSSNIQAKTKVRIICPLPQNQTALDSRTTIIDIRGRNTSGRTPSCAIIERTGHVNRWTKMPTSGSRGYFSVGKTYTKRDPMNPLSISCVLERRDYISKIRTYHPKR